MITEQQIATILSRINSTEELNGCRVGLRADARSRSLQAGNASSPNYGTVVIIEEVAQSGSFLVDIETAAVARPEAATPVTAAITPTRVLNGSRQREELVGAGASCTLAVISLGGVVAGAAGAIPSGGTSLVVSIASWTGLVTGGLQCINGIYRAHEAYTNPESDSLQVLDDNAYYSAAFFLIDATGVIAGIVSGVGAYSAIRATLAARGGLVTESALSAMNNAARRAAIRSALQRTAATPEGRIALTRALRGTFTEAQIANAIRNGAGSVRNSRIISQAVLRGLSRQLYIDLAGLISLPVGMGLNLTRSSYVGSASGSLSTVREWYSEGMESNTVGRLIIHVIQ